MPPPRTARIGDLLALAVPVTVNGEQRNIPDPCTVEQLLSLLEVGDRRVAVAVNGEVVPRSTHATAALREGDRIEVLEAVGGG